MAAEIIEQAELENAPDIADLPSDPLEADQETIVASLESGVEDNPEAEAELPEKYRGKSLQEVVGMHQQAEQLIGKQSGEVGELRSVVDQYVLKQLNEGNTQQEPAPEPVDFFEDPDKAVQHAIDSHPAVRQANQAAAQMQQTTAMSALQQKHPDMKEVLADSKFADWVQASKVRTQLFRQADQNYDAEVADELLTLYKERAGVVQQAMQQEQVARKGQVKAASTGATGQAGASTGKRVYRRADIIKLMKNDPDRYEALSGELMQAYAEGRVR